MSYTNEEDIFDSFPGIGNVISSDVVCVVSYHATITIIVQWSYLHSRDIVHRDIKPASVLVSNSHYKSCKHEELEMAFGKKPIVFKLGDLGEARSMNTQTNVLTGKNCRIAVRRGGLAFIVPELIIEEISVESAGIDELKTIDV